VGRQCQPVTATTTDCAQLSPRPPQPSSKGGKKKKKKSLSPFPPHEECLARKAFIIKQDREALGFRHINDLDSETQKARQKQTHKILPPCLPTGPSICSAACTYLIKVHTRTKAVAGPHVPLPSSLYHLPAHSPERSCRERWQRSGKMEDTNKAKRLLKASEI